MATIYSSPCNKCSALEQKLNEMEEQASQQRLAVAHLAKTWQYKLQGLESNFTKQKEDVLRSCKEEKDALLDRVSCLQTELLCAKDGGGCDKCTVLEEKVKNMQEMQDRAAVALLQLQNLNGKHIKEIEDAVKPYKQQCASLVQKMAMLQAIANRNGKTFEEIKVNV